MPSFNPGRAQGASRARRTRGLGAVRAQSLSTRAVLGDVVVFSREEQARQQRAFIHEVLIVAGIGFLGEVGQGVLQPEPRDLERRAAVAHHVDKECECEGNIFGSHSKRRGVGARLQHGGARE